MSNEQRSALAERQARFKQRMQERGYKRKTAWLHEPSEAVGYERGLSGEWPIPGPDGIEDALSYFEGWLRGAGDRIVPIFCTSCAEQVGMGPARESRDLLADKPNRLVCDSCQERLRQNLALL